MFINTVRKSLQMSLTSLWEHLVGKKNVCKISMCLNGINGFDRLNHFWCNNTKMNIIIIKKKWTSNWACNLLCVSTPAGRTVFTSFLKSEFSQENIDFWMACQDYKKTSPAKLAARARKIYQQYVEADAPNEVITPPWSTIKTPNVKQRANNLLPLHWRTRRWTWMRRPERKRGRTWTTPARVVSTEPRRSSTPWWRKTRTGASFIPSWWTSSAKASIRRT